MQFSHCCFLDGSHYSNGWRYAPCIIAAGSKASLTLSRGDPFKQLLKFHEQQQDWLFGHFTYEVKKKLFIHDDDITVPPLFFFCPQIIILLSADNIKIGISENENEAKKIFSDIQNFYLQENYHQSFTGYVQQQIDDKTYLKIVRDIQHHIHRGDCYEVNFCRKFFAEKINIAPAALFAQLPKMPFSACYRLHNQYLLCASPERFLMKKGKQIISQPMKGTARRSDNAAEDEQLKIQLQQSSKERAENVMIVDLVRHDLSRTAIAGSVQVKELFGVHTFPTVHQLVSVVHSELNPQYHFTDVINDAFPMGSMTGAPKIKVMELIELYEKSPRGLYSGSVGYITPEGDFDFNVVIRSILYNDAAKYLSFSAGSGITFYSNPQQELEECLLKAKAIREIIMLRL